MRGHTKSLDANDKLIQTRSHERDTIASRKRLVAMRQVKSTIQSCENFRNKLSSNYLESQQSVLANHRGLRDKNSCKLLRKTKLCLA